jgi:Leucine-rich repeat (LRR) protein
VNIKSYLIGDKYAEALGNGLKYSTANKLNLAQNRLNPTGGLKILQGLNPNVKELDISDNKLGETNDCIDHLANNVIMDRRYQLDTLVLDFNRINDKQLEMLSEALIVSGNRTLRVLSLS